MRKTWQNELVLLEQNERCISNLQLFLHNDNFTSNQYILLRLHMYEWHSIAYKCINLSRSMCTYQWTYNPELSMLEKKNIWLY